MTDQTFPLDVYGKPPALDRNWVSLSAGNLRTDGAAEALHTGGVWSDGEEAWKPLFIRPWANTTCLTRSDEDVILSENADTLLFPRNWRVEHVNGLPWLVRPVVYTVSDGLKGMLTQEKLFAIEQRIRKLNRDGWVIGDVITFAVDKKTRSWMLLDLSSARRLERQSDFAPYDDDYMAEAWKWAGFERYAQLRNKARFVEADLGSRVGHLDSYGEDTDLAFAVTHTYASLNRPLSMMWMKKPEQEYILMPGRGYEPHSWLCTVGPLPAEYMRSYELTLAWANWPGPLYAESEE